MFEISMAKDPALSLLYGLLAIATTFLSVAHYSFGHFDILLINLICIAIFSFSSFFLFLSRDRTYGRYISVLTITSVALLMQYQLFFEPKLSVHWIYMFPILAHFALPLSWATGLNIAVLISTYSQLIYILELSEVFRFSLVYILIGMCSWCYAFLNFSKQNKLLELAVTDYKSGAFNSQHLLKTLHQEIARSEVTHRTLSLLAMTIDDHQQIIEIHGRNNSEKILKEFTNKLSTLLRAGDEIFHNAKGTFYILLPNCPEDGVMLLKERLQQQLDGIQWGEVGELQLNTGIATLKKNENAHDFLQRASEHVQKQQQTALRLMAFN